MLMNNEKSRAAAIVLRLEYSLQIFTSFSHLCRKFFKREETIEQAIRTVISEVLFDFDQLSVLDENEYF